MSPIAPIEDDPELVTRAARAAADLETVAFAYTTAQRVVLDGAADPLAIHDARERLRTLPSERQRAELVAQGIPRAIATDRAEKVREAQRQAKAPVMERPRRVTAKLSEAFEEHAALLEEILAIRATLGPGSDAWAVEVLVPAFTPITPGAPTVHEDRLIRLREAGWL